MHILVLDGAHVEAEFREKFGPNHQYTFSNPNTSPEWPDIIELEQWEQVKRQAFASADVVFVCGSDNHRYKHYNHFTEGALWPGPYVVFQECTARKLEFMPQGPPIFGFCGLPTLLNRRLLEVSLYHEADRAKLAETCAALGTDYRVVADRVGLVTPRVICQIINEACFTVQEGTATMQDVDLGMKLGTNYPHGPFAWANAIGVERVYAVLEALWHDTHDERYKVCPLLKRQALRGEPFAI